MKILLAILTFAAAGNACALDGFKPMAMEEISAMKVSAPAPVYDSVKGMNSTHRFYAPTHTEGQTRLERYTAALEKAGIKVISASVNQAAGMWECFVIYEGSQQRIFTESKSFMSAAFYGKAQSACENRKKELTRDGAIVIEGSAAVSYSGPAPIAYYDLAYIK